MSSKSSKTSETILSVYKYIALTADHMELSNINKSNNNNRNRNSNNSNKNIISSDNTNDSTDYTNNDTICFIFSESIKTLQ